MVRGQLGGARGNGTRGTLRGAIPTDSANLGYRSEQVGKAARLELCMTEVFERCLGAYGDTTRRCQHC